MDSLGRLFVSRAPSSRDNRTDIPSFDRRTLSGHPDVRIVLHHLAAQMSRKGHQRGIRCAGFCHFRDRLMAQVWNRSPWNASAAVR
jgi:hypothetical protein